MCRGAGTPLPNCIRHIPWSWEKNNASLSLECSTPFTSYAVVCFMRRYFGYVTPSHIHFYYAVVFIGWKHFSTIINCDLEIILLTLWLRLIHQWLHLAQFASNLVHRQANLNGRRCPTGTCKFVCMKYRSTSYILWWLYSAACLNLNVCRVSLGINIVQPTVYVATSNMIMAVLLGKKEKRCAQ